MLEFIQDNFVAVELALFLIVFTMTNTNFPKKISRLFLAAAICVLLLIVEVWWEDQLSQSAVYEPLRVPLSAIGYTLRPMTVYFMTLMTIKTSGWKFILYSAPLVVNAIIAFSPFFAHISYWYTPDNQFVRGPLWITPFIVSGFYIFALFIQVMKTNRKCGAVETMIVAALVLSAFLSTIIESALGVRSIQNPTIAASLIFYYLFLHSSQSNRDSLTGIWVRRRFYLDAERRRATISAVVSIDLNDLKKINDQFGHMAGDKALVVVADTIRKSVNFRSALYRTGGDEFMILCHKMSEESVQAMIADIRSRLEETEYRCAIGYAMCTPDCNFDHVCQVADDIMYENKRLIKGDAPRDYRQRQLKQDE